MKQEEDGGSKLRVWVADVKSGKARPLFQSPDVFLNAVFDKYRPFSGFKILNKLKIFQFVM